MASCFRLWDGTVGFGERGKNYMIRIILTFLIMIAGMFIAIWARFKRDKQMDKDLGSIYGIYFWIFVFGVFLPFIFLYLTQLLELSPRTSDTRRVGARLRGRWIREK